ncbi:MAG TPA: hypothetical protein VFA43_00125 [Gemmatimonadaceae bacterium]|nr:hypothetical protein [Gemmatimonadaceae bacterium]
MADGIEFEGEVPIPQWNLELYRRIYLLEQWLRRIVMAGLMSRYATQWRSAIPTEISANLKQRRRQLAARTFLDVESSDNVVWLLTLEELKQLMTSNFIWPSVKELTGLQRADVLARVDELREIRNVVGHNRATTPRTLRIFEGVEQYLGQGIDHFRNETLYSESNAIFSHAEDEPLAEAVEALWEPGTRQVFLQASDRFYAMVSLPVPPFAYISVPDLVEAIHDVRHLILAVYVNGVADEFSVVWPRGALDAEHQQVIEAIAAFHVGRHTELPYSEQDPKHVCDPRIWFYFDALRPGGWPPTMEDDR